MSILDQIETRINGRRYDTYIAAKCPFHSDSHASLMVYEDVYKCLACNAFGPTRNLLRKLGCTAVIYSAPIKDDTIIHVSNPFSVWLKRNTLEEVMLDAWKQFNQFPQTATYITNVRKIDEETRKGLGIGVKDGFYTFPIFKEKQLVGAFVRSPHGADVRYFVPKGQDPNLLYIPFRGRDSRVLFVTFGGIDAISIRMLGFACASTTGGKHIDHTAFDDIRKRIIFLPDKDEEEEARRIASKLGWRGQVHELDYPDGTKDCNDYFRVDKEKLKNELERII